jgi:hypothetical protein
MTDACEKINDWNWKIGELYSDVTTGKNLDRNYFDCGMYYFDGLFNVVKFPRGMTLYHGSGALANALVEFPVGKHYYTPGQRIPQLLSVVANSKESIEHEVAKYAPITAGWYADPRTAKLYSVSDDINIKNNCGKNCINVYKLNKDIVLFLLDDDYNITKLLKSNEQIVPTEQKNNLMKMFSLTTTDADRTNMDNPFQRLRFNNKNRKSSRDYDLKFAEWMCSNVVTPFKYSGYAATTQSSSFHGGKFHLEFVFCNAFKYLSRDFSNELDWQHNPNVISNSPITEYVSQLKLYESTNINFHSGNLLEHSVWSLLFAEDLIDRNLKVSTYFTQEQARIKILKIITCFAAFIHDVGKMSPENCSKNKHRRKFIYFDIENHTDIGYNYIMADKVPFYNEHLHLKKGNPFSIKEMFKYVYSKNGETLKDEQYDIIKIIFALVSKYHRIFGFYYLKSKSENKDNIAEFVSKVSSEVIGYRWNKDYYKMYMYVLIVVSLSDNLSVQPYGVDRLKNFTNLAELNKSSAIIPEIVNLPKKYPGGEVRLDADCLKYADMILKFI